MLKKVFFPGTPAFSHIQRHAVSLVRLTDDSKWLVGVNVSVSVVCLFVLALTGDLSRVQGARRLLPLW